MSIDKLKVKSREAILEDIKGRERLIVSFGGFHQGLGIPLFEFFKSLDRYNCDKIFIRDFNQAWYHLGINKELASIDDIKNWLKEKIFVTNHYQSVCFLGNSMGGFAAILLGVLLDIDQVIAFSPQSFIDKKTRIKNLDFRWRKELKRLHQSLANSTSYNLQQLLNITNYSTKIDIHFAKNDRLDRKHARYLTGCAHVKLRRYEHPDHNLVKKLRDTGTLNQILKEALI